MARNTDKTVLCQICKKQKLLSSSVIGEIVKPSVVSTIMKTYPDWSSEGYICFSDLNHFRAEYVREILEDERGEVSGIEQEVIKSLSEHDLLSIDTAKEYEDQLTFGERMADKVAAFAGSWGFIGFATSVIIVWILLNVLMVVLRWDPYPFILLNLVLSCIAALQAPIIIMSQNRQDRKSKRLNSSHGKLSRIPSSS